MPTCKEVADFLGEVRARSVTSVPPDAQTARLAELQLIQLLNADQYRDLAAQLDSIDAAGAAISQEAGERAQLAGELERDQARDHSVLFHLHGQAARDAGLAEEEKARSDLERTDADLAQKEQAFNQLLGKRALRDSLTPCGAQYVGLTVAGAVALRDLTVRLYRYADADFETYLGQARHIDQELEQVATGGSTYFTALAGAIPGADRSYLWAIGIGLAKSTPDPSSGVPAFVEAYRATGDLSGNLENRLLTSEILLAVPGGISDKLPPLTQLVHDVRSAGVPKEAALGVASIVLFGRRADGSFATENVRQFLTTTRSYESAALLGIVNAPQSELLGRFQALRAMFTGFGYSYSDDTELASAYLAVSENEPAQISSKLAILARGLSAYLQYPLVAAAILGSIATLEANEALALVEKAYAVVGRRAAGLAQPELICLAVRMVHGIRNELVSDLDATATAAPTAPRAVGYGYGPRGFFVPIVIIHGSYYATFGGIGGVHPGHVHGMPAGFGGVGVG